MIGQGFEYISCQTPDVYAWQGRCTNAAFVWCPRQGMLVCNAHSGSHALLDRRGHRSVRDAPSELKAAAARVA